MRFSEIKARAGKVVLRPGVIVIGCAVLVFGCQTMVTHMSEEQRLYRAKCSSCHQPVDPGTRTPDQWHARLAHHGPKLTDAERAAILRYLTQQVPAGPETPGAP